MQPISRAEGGRPQAPVRRQDATSVATHEVNLVVILHPLKRSIGLLRQFNPNQVADLHLATRPDNTHDTGLADEIALFVTSKYRCPQTRSELVKLVAGIAQASHFDYRCGANMQLCASWQPQ